MAKRANIKVVMQRLWRTLYFKQDKVPVGLKVVRTEDLHALLDEMEKNKVLLKYAKDELEAATKGEKARIVGLNKLPPDARSEIIKKAVEKVLSDSKSKYDMTEDIKKAKEKAQKREKGLEIISKRGGEVWFMD